MKKIIISIIISSFLSQAPVFASEAYLGEIRNFSGLNFCPRGWADADGRLLQVSQNDALFSLFGTIYGGDGRTTFGLPDLRGRMAIHQGDGPGLSNRPIGSKGGSETETLTVNQLPSHTHNFVAKQGRAVTTKPFMGTVSFAQSGIFRTGGTQQANLHTETIGTTGGSQAHENMGPSLVTNYCVALVGIYPSR